MSARRWRDLDGADPYEVLGVPRDAQPREVIRAHRELVRLLHPDLPGGSEEKTKRLHLARDILLEPATRAEYDNHVGGSIPTEESTEPERPDAWDADDVEPGAGSGRTQPTTARWPPPSASQPPEGDVIPEAYEPYFQPHRVPPFPYVPRYPPRPPASEISALAITALVMACVFAPVGLILGIIALCRSQDRGPTRTISIIAVCVGAISTITCFGCFGLIGLSSILPSPSSTPSP